MGEKFEDMTGTQAHRFEELTTPAIPDQLPDASATGTTRYTLTEASGRLNISEKQLLQQAASGSVHLYINATGLKGCWRRGSADSDSTLPVQTLISGYLALTSRSCGGMAGLGSSNVSVLEYRCPPDPSAVDLDDETMATLAAWGDDDKYFCLQESVWVEDNMVVLIAPLPILADLAS